MARAPGPVEGGPVGVRRAAGAAAALSGGTFTQTRDSGVSLRLARAPAAAAPRLALVASPAAAGKGTYWPGPPPRLAIRAGGSLTVTVTRAGGSRLGESAGVPVPWQGARPVAAAGSPRQWPP